MQSVFAGENTVLSPLLRPIEAVLYSLAGIKRGQEQGWFNYALAFLLFHLPGMGLLYLVLRLCQFPVLRSFLTLGAAGWLTAAACAHAEVPPQRGCTSIASPSSAG